MIGYITTYYSFFGVVLLVTFLFAFLMNLFQGFSYIRKAIALILAFFIFICSVLTDYSNHAVEQDIRSANLRFRAVDEMIRTDMYQSIPGRSSFFAADLYKNPFHSAHNLTEQSFDWGYYFGIRSGKDQYVIRNEKDFIVSLKDTTRQSYYLSMQQAVKDDDIILTVARIIPFSLQDTIIPSFVNHAWVLYYSKYKIFTVSFNCKSHSVEAEVPLRINHIRDTIQPGNKNVEFTIYNTHPRHAATYFMINADNIDYKSIRVSNQVNPQNKIFYL
jgi:hypothetical protein